MGLHLIEEFISPEEEAELLQYIESHEGEWETYVLCLAVFTCHQAQSEESEALGIYF